MHLRGGQSTFFFGNLCQKPVNNKSKFDHCYDKPAMPNKKGFCILLKTVCQSTVMICTLKFSLRFLFSIP